MKTAIMKLSLVALTLLISLHGIQAQSVDEAAKDATSESVGPKKFWQADLQGGTYTVALERIASISKHCYSLDDKTIVTEVVIDTGGSSPARFYCPESTSKDSPQPTQKKPLATTQAKTVEFLISNRTDLDKLHDSARNAWIAGRGKKFTIHADQTDAPDP